MRDGSAISRASAVAAPPLARLYQWATEAVAAVLGVTPVEVSIAASLLQLPGFDSLAVVAVLDRLEAVLELEIPAELIVPEAFESLETLTGLLRQAVDQPPRASAGGAR